MRNLILTTTFIFLTISSSLLAGKTPEMKKGKELAHQWLIIFSSSRTYAQAIKAQPNISVKTHIIHSDDYDNLSLGWYITCLSYSTKAKAMQNSKSFKGEGIDNYIKYSGAYRGGDDYPITNHFKIYNGYLLFDQIIDSEDRQAILGFKNDRPYSVKISVKPEAISDNVAYFKNKEFIVYDGSGNRTTAKIKEFLAFNQINPHFGAVMNWSENNYTETEIRDAIIGYGGFRLAAQIEFEASKKNFRGKIAHLKGANNFAEIDLDEEIETENLFERFFKTNLAKELESDLINYEYADEEEMRKISIESGDMNIYKIDDTRFAIFNVIYADYAEGECGMDAYYENQVIIWNLNTNKMEVAEVLDGNRDSYFPYFIRENGKIKPWIFTETWFMGLRNDVGIIDQDCGC